MLDNQVIKKHSKNLVKSDTQSQKWNVLEQKYNKIRFKKF